MIPPTVIAAIALYLLAHEGGHFLTALLRKLKPKVTLDWRDLTIFGRALRVPVSIVIVYDRHKDRDSRWVSTMGFGGGLLVLGVLLCLEGIPATWVDAAFVRAYHFALTGHFVLYPFKKKNSISNDFNGMDADEDPRT